MKNFFKGLTKDSQLPVWMLIVGFIAVLTLPTQVRLPFAGGRLAVADVAAAAAFLMMMWHAWRQDERLYYPLGALALLICALATAWFSRPGAGALTDLLQMGQMFFCGLMFAAWFLKHAPLTAVSALTVSLAVNLLVAAFQIPEYGFGSVIAPADILALKWGIGHAYTGLFRSRMSLSFAIAMLLPFLQPAWFACTRPGILKMLIVLVFTVLALSLIPHGAMLLLGALALLISSLCQGWRSCLVNVLAIVCTGILIATGSSATKAVLAETLSPLKPDTQFAGELKTCHLDGVAALRLAARRPFWGVGPGRYQTFVGQCYGALPNPSYNDIDTDTQPAWGILPATYGYPVALLVLLALCASWVRALRNTADREGAENPERQLRASLRAGASGALVVLMLGMFFSDPFTRGLGWIAAFVLAAALLPENDDAEDRVPQFSFLFVLVAGMVLFLAIAPTAVLPASANTLQFSQQVQNRRGAASSAGPSLAVADADVFVLLNPSAVKEITAPFEAYSDSLTAEKSALRIVDGRGTPPDGTEPAMQYGGVRYEVHLDANAAVNLWLRVWWDGSCGNTLNAAFDDEPRSVTVGNDGTYRAWHWVSAPRTFTLAAGDHQLRILNREDGIALDQVLITNDLEYYPQDIEEMPGK